MRRAIYPGSFDPLTKGHLDLIIRSAAMVDELIVGVLDNPKKIALFSAQERVNIIMEVTRHIPGVRVEAFSGLLVDYARKEKANMIVRGLRAITDFDYELQMAQTNRILSQYVDTIFLATGLEYSYISSSTVKEVAMLGGDISKFVPSEIEEKIYRKIQEVQQKSNNHAQ